MKIEDNDDPKSIHAGPISAILILIKNRSNIHSRLCPKFKGFNNNDSITTNILDLLYNSENADTLNRLIAYLHTYNPIEAEALNDAVEISRNLSAHNRIRSIDYINHILQADIELLTALNPFIDDSPSMHVIMDWYLQALTQKALKKTMPVDPPHTIEQIKLYGMFTTTEDCENYLRNNGTGGSHANYNSNYAYSSYGQESYDRCCSLIPSLTWLHDIRQTLHFSFSSRPNDTRQPTAEVPPSQRVPYCCGIQ